MPSHRTRRPAPPRIACAPVHRSTLAPLEPGDAIAPARVVPMRTAGVWLATVVARLVAEDVASGEQTCRLVLRIESMTQPERAARTIGVRAWSLDEIPEETLRALIARWPRSRAGRTHGRRA